MTCPPCTHDCNQGRTCPARVRLTAERAVPAILARVAEMLKGGGYG